MRGAAPDYLTQQARAGVRRVSWRSAALGAGGASASGLLGAAAGDAERRGAGAYQRALCYGRSVIPRSATQPGSSRR